MKSKIVAQFRHPSGLLGALAGRIMAARRSNRFRNDRTVDLMALSPNSRVLEIGCGPGLALARCASVVTSGRVVGLDHSDVMIRQARNRAIKQGVADRITLIEGGVDRLADWPDAFDRIFSLNVIQFQSDKSGFFSTVYDALVAGGLCLTTYQPRLDADGSGAARRMIASIEDALHAVGFENVTEIEIIGGATPATCVIGQKNDTSQANAITNQRRLMMAQVLGIGGFFFRSEDPAALAEWYETHLGILPAPASPTMQPWISEQGVTIFTPFPKDSDYFPEDRGFMLNFRVADLDATIKELNSAGIESGNEVEMEGVGKFARIHDPEGNPIELWEPVQV